MTQDTILLQLILFSNLLISIGVLIQGILIRTETSKIESIETQLQFAIEQQQIITRSLATSLATQALMYKILQSTVTTEYRSLDGNLAAGTIEELLDKMRNQGLTPPNPNDPNFKNFLDKLKEESEEDGDNPH